MAFGFKCPQISLQRQCNIKTSFNKENALHYCPTCSTKCSQASILFYNPVCESLKQVKALKMARRRIHCCTAFDLVAILTLLIIHIMGGYCIMIVMIRSVLAL